MRLGSIEYKLPITKEDLDHPYVIKIAFPVIQSKLIKIQESGVHICTQDNFKVYISISTNERFDKLNQT
jgi:hypothetical protein